MVSPRSARPLKRQQGKGRRHDLETRKPRIIESGNQESRKGISEIEGKAARIAAKKRG
jgi:hypothetical protein